MPLVAPVAEPVEFGQRVVENVVAGDAGLPVVPVILLAGPPEV